MKTRAPPARAAVAVALGAAAGPAAASFLSGDALDTMADYIALFVLFIVPIGAVVLFWMVHVLPEKIAEKRHHPQKDAIHTLCLLSLVFGGLLWPFAWLWAYTRPVAFRAAYGTERHEDYYAEMGEKARSGTLLRDDIRGLRTELDSMAERGHLPPELANLREELDRLHDLAQERAAVPPTEKGN